jgi:YHS domain-containing protein
MTPLGTVLLPDPVGGIWLRAESAATTFTFLGQTYAFCCTECRDLFSRCPELYIAQLAHEPCRLSQRCIFNRRIEN